MGKLHNRVSATRGLGVIYTVLSSLDSWNLKICSPIRPKNWANEHYSSESHRFKDWCAKKSLGADANPASREYTNYHYDQISRTKGLVLSTEQLGVRQTESGPPATSGWNFCVCHVWLRVVTVLGSSTESSVSKFPTSRVKQHIPDGIT